MKRILAILLLVLPVCLSAQFRIVGEGLFTTINDSTYRAQVTFRPDLTGNSYNATQLDTTMFVLSQRGQFYRLDSFYNQDFSSAFIVIVEKNGNWGSPSGQVMVFKNSGSIAAPQTVYAANGATPAMQAQVDTWNSKLIKSLLDSTELWNEAYTSIIDSAKFTGANTKLLSLYQRDGSTVTASFKEQEVYVDTASGNAATINITNAGFEASTATVVANNLSSVQIPWDGNAIVGIVTQGTIQQGVLIQGSGIITINETPQNPGGTINIDATVPSEYVTYSMLSQGVKDSIKLDSLGETNLTFLGTDTLITLQSSNGKDVKFQAGNNMALSANDSVMTINGVTTLTLTQGTGGDTAFVIVDGLSSLRLPWDGNSVIGNIASGPITNDVIISVNGQSETFQVGVIDGPKGDINVQGNNWTIDTSAVDWITLSQETKDSIYANAPGKTNLTFTGVAAPYTLNSNTGSDVRFNAGNNVSLSIQDSTLVIEGVTSISSLRQVLNNGFSVIVDALSTARTPWDGNAVVGNQDVELTDNITVTVNGQSTTFDISVKPGNKGDVTVTESSWEINPSTVSWNELTQGVKDSINQKLENPVDSILFTTTNENTAIEGELTYNNQSGTLHLGMAGGIEMPVGQGEAHLVRNVTGTTIAKGKVVYISGSTGQRPQISLADADAEGTSSVTFGITAETIAPNDSGFVFTSGYIHGINTNALTQGEALWLDTAPGGFTHTKPVAPVNAVLVGYVITKKTNGTIFVKIQNGYEIDELHNVVTAGKVLNSVIRYDTTSKMWQASATAGIVAGDTTAMLSTYLKKADTLSLSNRINTKQNTLTNSAGLAAALNDETGTGVAVFNDAPSFNTSITVNGNGVISRAPAASAITHIAVFAADPLNTARSIATRTPTQLRGDIGAQSTLTNSAGLAAALSDEVGNGAAVFNTNATMKQTLIVDNDSTSSISFGGWLSLKFNNQNRWNIAVQTPFVNNDLYFNDVANSRTPLALSRTNGFVGINEVSPSRQLHVTGEARITDLTTDTPTRIVGADADGDLGAATIGAGLEIVSGELKQKILTASDSLDFGSLGAWSSELKTITLTNAALSDPVTLGIPNSSSASVNVVFTAYVSAADTVTVKATNAGSTTVDPGKGLFKIIVHKY